MLHMYGRNRCSTASQGLRWSAIAFLGLFGWADVLRPQPCVSDCFVGATDWNIGGFPPNGDFRVNVGSACIHSAYTAPGLPTGCGGVFTPFGGNCDKPTGLTFVNVIGASRCCVPVTAGVRGETIAGTGAVVNTPMPITIEMSCVKYY